LVCAGTMAQTPGTTKNNEEQWREYHEKLRKYQQDQQEYLRKQQQWQQYQQQQQQWQQWQQYQQQQQTAAFQAQMRAQYQNVHPTISYATAASGHNLRSTFQTLSQPQFPVRTATAPPFTQPPQPAAPPLPTEQPPATIWGKGPSSQPSPSKKIEIPAPPKKEPVKEKKTKRAGFPPTLQRYVENSIRQCVEDEKLRERVEEKLKGIIENSLAKGDMWERDWDREPLPLGLSQRTKSSPRHGSESRSSPKGRKRGKSSEPVDTNGEYKKTKRGKKRKKKKGSREDESAPSTFLGMQERNMREKRMERFNKEKDTKEGPAVRWDPYRAMKERRGVKQAMEAAEYFGTKLDLNKFVIKGTCQDLEKPYLRLTSAPDSSNVRPEEVLHKSLANVMKKWALRARAKGKGVTYLWACEQLKSIRQDLTIQHIKNNFTCKVYETHARIAIEQEDLKEFNQCQTKLVELYLTLGSPECHREFAAYRIFYQVYTRYKYNQPSSEMAMLLGSLTSEQRESNVVKHALKVYAAVDQCDYASFFRLYLTVPNMGVYLLDLLVDYVRHGAIQRTFRGYRPNIPLQNIHDMLLYGGSAKSETHEEWKNFVEQEGMHYLKRGKPVNAKDVWANMSDVMIDTKASWGAINGPFMWKVLDGDNVQRSED